MPNVSFRGTPPWLCSTTLCRPRWRGRRGSSPRSRTTATARTGASASSSSRAATQSLGQSQELRKTQVPPSGPQSCHQAAPGGSGKSYTTCAASGHMGKKLASRISLAARVLHIGVVLGHQEPLGGHQATIFWADGGTLGQSMLNSFWSC